MEIIRKLSVGPDYKNAMHYIVGQHVLGGSHVIKEIKQVGPNEYKVWIINEDNEIKCWKTVTNMPCKKENNIDF